MELKKPHTFSTLSFVRVIREINLKIDIYLGITNRKKCKYVFFYTNFNPNVENMWLLCETILLELLKNS